MFGKKIRMKYLLIPVLALTLVGCTKTTWPDDGTAIPGEDKAGFVAAAEPMGLAGNLSLARRLCAIQHNNGADAAKTAEQLNEQDTWNLAKQFICP